MTVAKLVGVEASGFRWWCPGCESHHIVPIAGMNAWGFNGDLEKPTLIPSVLVYGHLSFIDHNLDGEALLADTNKRMTPRCHTFIVDGRIQFLADCTHLLAGQTVDMLDLAEG